MIKIGILGCGKIAHRFVKGAFETSNTSVTACATRDLERAQQFADLYRIKSVYADYEALVSDPEIDAIYVASPNDLHFEQSVAILRAGKHAITEKPFVSNMHEFEALMAVVKETGKFCFDAILPLHHPNLKVIKEALPSIGRMKMMMSNMVQYSSRYKMVLNGQIPNIFSPEHSGGALMDLGVYSTSISVALFGKPESLTYACNKLDNGIDTSGTMVLKYPAFVVSNTFGKDSFGINNMTFCGEEASLQIPLQPSRLLSVERVTIQEREELGVKDLRDGMVYELLDFASIINENDWNTYQSFMNITKDVIACLDEARRQNGIVFRTDR